jgi:hypothetical protein
MKLVLLKRGDIITSPELSRSKSSTKQFEERLQASIEEIGLVEPIKVAQTPDGKYLVVDGSMRLNAVDAIRKSDPLAFPAISAYIVSYEQRFEVRFQTDIYQDLLPSQLAALVEHLHQSENILKADIARYIGVSPPTVRNYTGLWRMIQRGGLFEQLVELMDVGVVPASNPYAWLRLNDYGLRVVLQGEYFSGGERAEPWIADRERRARRGDVRPYAIKEIENATNGLESHCYREDEQVRLQKRDLGLRRSQPFKARDVLDTGGAVEHLKQVSRRSREPVLRSAARSLSGYLQ